jgi:hypothetical protein
MDPTDVARKRKLRVVPNTKPDFSGDWRLNLGESRLSPEVAAAATGGDLRIWHREPTLRYHGTVLSGDKPIEVNSRSSQSGRGPLQCCLVSR